MTANELTLLLSSAGRRPYLVQWFRDALIQNGLAGRLIVADSDEHAASRMFADDFIVAPTVVDSAYESWLEAVLESNDVALAVSVNDFELSHWANLKGKFPGADRLLSLDANTQKIVEDKIQTAAALVSCGVPVPRTLTAVEALKDRSKMGSSELVTKGRYGSASRGLRVTSAADLARVVGEAVRDVTDRAGRLADAWDPSSLELLVVQPKINGIEYGLDVVCDLDGRYVTTFARQKISMRAGETDRAESVDADAFYELGRRIVEAVPHHGLIDVDVIVDAQGEPWVIDVNPRFGGGYPFSHLAGAHIPAAYVAWLLGSPPDPSWLRCEPGIVGSKYVGVARAT